MSTGCPKVDMHLNRPGSVCVCNSGCWTGELQPSRVFSSAYRACICIYLLKAVLLFRADSILNFRGIVHPMATVVLWKCPRVTTKVCACILGNTCMRSAFFDHVRISVLIHHVFCCWFVVCHERILRKKRSILGCCVVLHHPLMNPGFRCIVRSMGMISGVGLIFRVSILNYTHIFMCVSAQRGGRSCIEIPGIM